VRHLRQSRYTHTPCLESALESSAGKERALWRCTMTLPVPSSYHPEYARLTAYLAARDEQQITLTFTQLEQAILLAPLPYGARRQTNWWSNTPSRLVPHNRAWLRAGWRVASVDRTSGTVRFER